MMQDAVSSSGLRGVAIEERDLVQARADGSFQPRAG
jgi:hypothetical protein